MNKRQRRVVFIFFIPVSVTFLAFFILPMLKLAFVSTQSPAGLEIYWDMLVTARYLEALLYTILLSGAVTLVTLVIAGISGVFLTRNDFFGRDVLVAMLTFPLAFPGVVVGFMIILLAGRQGLVGEISKDLFNNKIVLAYSIIGLFLGYLYFSIPRVITTVMAAAEKIDRNLEEAARSLGASPLLVVRDVIIPALTPGLISSGAICFATSMGAFGTAFTLATDFDVLPIVIYTEFTLSANIAMASALSILLGLITWGALSLARTAAGETLAASG